jgi:polyferredoxin
MAVTLAVLFLVPLLGLARFDAWGGAHRVLGRDATGIEAFLAVGAGIAIFYLATFLVNAALGRAFCGWGCPVAQVSRLGEAIDIAWRQGKPAGKARSVLRAGAFGALLSLSIVLWWVSPRAFVEGGWGSLAATWGAWAALTGATFLHGRHWRWSFCRKACPIGIYYSVVAFEKPLQIVFEQDLGTCKDCRACDLICPVHLDPRRLEAPVEWPGGLAIDCLPGHQHCLRCGDCVKACEHVFRREPETPVPLHFGHAASSPGTAPISAGPVAAGAQEEVRS